MSTVDETSSPNNFSLLESLKSTLKLYKNAIKELESQLQLEAEVNALEDEFNNQKNTDVDEINTAISSEVAVTTKKSTTPKKKKKKGKKEHGTKQALIDKSHNDLVTHYTKLGLYQSDGFLRGEDTIRIHVKTVPTLENIEDLLKEIRTKVGITQIVIPISMKNSHQKKGYTVFAKFASAEDIPKVQAIVEKHSHIFQCEIALVREYD